MAKKLLIIDPASEHPEVVDTCLRLKLEPVAMVRPDAANRPDGTVRIETDSFDAQAIIDAARSCRAAGVWAVWEELWPEAMQAAARLNMAHVPVDAAHFWDETVQQRLAAMGVATPSAHLVFRAEAAETLVPQLGMPVWVRSLVNDDCMLVEHTEDLPLAVLRGLRSAPGCPVVLQHAAEGPVYSVFGYKVGLDFKPVEVVSVSMQPGLFRVPAMLVVPPGLGGGPYTKVLDLAEKAVRALPLASGAVQVEVVLGPTGALVTHAAFLHGIDPVLAELLHTALGVDILADALRVAAGDRPIASPCRELAAAVGWLETGSGVITGISGVEAARAMPGVGNLVLNARPGDSIGHVTDTVSRAATGYIVAYGPARPAAIAALEIARKAIHIATEPMAGLKQT